jgi:uncharacterized protein
MEGLGRRFHPPEAYRSSERYVLLPFRFIELDAQRSRYIVTNLIGEHAVCTPAELDQLVSLSLPDTCDLFRRLESIHIIARAGEHHTAVRLLAIKERTRRSSLPNFTSLHIFVVTLRCDYSCPYCQVSRQTEDVAAYDMTEATARRAIDFVFRSPSPAIKIEFQGGESLLNFDLIRFVVLECEARNTIERRDLQFVIATNLSPISDEILDFCLGHEISISTSLDGPPDTHNKNRPRPGRDGYELTREGIRRCQRTLGSGHVSALMTTTEASLPNVRNIIDEYIGLGLNGIFLRALSPYGFAIRTRQYDRYSVERWLDFFREGLDHIIEVNRQGHSFREFYSSIVLRRLLTPHPTGYVDLQSPAGLGIAAIVFNYDGNVYPSDEARMLVEMGDDHFRLGNLHNDSYEEIIGSDVLLDSLDASFADSVPLCDRCAFNPICGSDPVYHYATQGDVIGNKAVSGFCQRNMGIFRELIVRMENDPFARTLFENWAWQR